MKPPWEVSETVSEKQHVIRLDVWSGEKMRGPVSARVLKISVGGNSSAFAFHTSSRRGHTYCSCIIGAALLELHYFENELEWKEEQTTF